MSRREIYDRTGWDYTESRYGTPNMQGYLAARNRVLREHVGPVAERGGKVLDVGCGTGLSLRAIAADNRGARLFGTDFSHTMAVQTRASLGPGNVRLSLADARHLPYPDETFDLVYSTRFIHQFENKKPIFDEFRRVTKPNGVIVVEFYGRFFHWFRYWVSGPRASRESFLSHFPDQREVRAVVGTPFETVPLRLAGAKVALSLLGARGLQSLTQVVGRGPLSFLVDEYFVVARK